ncbi:hypothetical protein [Pedobacter caeni]|uniref:Uncharacterized protein n=1 Tax=Pedobacter caeni TaxID=288992 RepID=A0A1M5M2X0_9SPHI|nr:hypothetical protein [Pedobacter caeni]SHG71566.1 hypothetical protein SAMN04488522_10745 [Pedobacter caeni]
MELLVENSTYDIVGSPYQFYVDFTVKDLLNEEEHKIFDQINAHYAACFSLIKTKDPVLASQNLEQGNALLEQSASMVKKLVNVFCLPFISYYYYKIKDYKSAIDKSNFIIAKVTELESANHEYLFFCKIQQQQNLGRISWATGDIEKTVKIHTQCVLDIYDKAGNWDINRSIHNVPVMVLVENTQYLFFIQVITEMLARLVSRFKTEKVVAVSWIKLFIEPLRTLNFDHLAPYDPRYRAFDSYLRMFGDLVDGNEEGFVEEASAFLDNSLFDEEMKKVVGRYLYYFGYI